MTILPPPLSHTVAAIDAAHETAARTGDSAGLPVSAVANPCDRALFYLFRWAAEPERPSGPRERRFRTGLQYERWLLDDLRAIGCDVCEIDETTGKQFRLELANGHLRGKIDGVALGLPEAPKTWHLVECKSHNDKSFKELTKKKLRDGKPEHFSQVQLYLHGLSLTRCLYMAANKNTEELYCERIEYDAAFCLALVARIERIVATQRPPSRLHEDPDSKAAFACQWCAAKGICHEGQFARVTCRSCLHSSPIDGGKWWCERYNKELSYKEQQAACTDHRFLPELVPGTQEDVLADDVIVYLLKNGSEWLDGKRE